MLFRKSVETNGICQPPKNTVAHELDSTNIETYSARKKAANLAELNSVWKPATSSLSPSARSKGARLVSANIQTRKSRKDTGEVMKPQCQKYEPWSMTILLR